MESRQHVPTLYLLNFALSVLVNEILNMHKATTHTHENLVAFFHLDVNALLTELVYAFTFSQEHDLQLFAFWEFVEVIAKSGVDLVVLLRDVHSLVLLQHFVDFDEFFNLVFGQFVLRLNLLELLNQVQLGVLHLVNLLFHGNVLFFKLADGLLEFAPGLVGLIQLFLQG